VIARFVEACSVDERIVAAFLGGSLARGGCPRTRRRRRAWSHLPDRTRPVDGTRSRTPARRPRL